MRNKKDGVTPVKMLQKFLIHSRRPSFHKYLTLVFEKSSIDQKIAKGTQFYKPKLYYC